MILVEKGWKIVFWVIFIKTPSKRPVAQLAERRSPKPKVGGSMPSWPAIQLELYLLIINS